MIDMYYQVFLLKGKTQDSKQEQIYVIADNIEEAILQGRKHFTKNKGVLFDAESKASPLFIPKEKKGDWF